MKYKTEKQQIFKKINEIKAGFLEISAKLINLS